MRFSAVSLFLVACTQSQDFTSPPAPIAPPPATDPLAPAACGTTDDPESCGACGHSCLGGTCSSGTCGPVILARGQKVDVYGPQAIFTTDTHAIWVVGDRIARVPIGGGAVEELGRQPMGPYANVRLDDGFLYFLSPMLDAIERVPLAGGPRETVTPPLAKEEHVTPSIQRFEVLHGELAWEVSWSADSPEYLRFPRLYSCDAAPCAIARDHWSDPEIMPGALGKSAKNLWAGYGWPQGASKQGTGVTCLGDAYGDALVTNGFGELQIEELADRAYVYGASIGFVGRATVPVVTPQGNQPYVPDKVLASDPDMTSVVDLLLDGDDLFWVANYASIRRVDKTGATLPEVYVAGQFFSHLASGKDALYFTTEDGDIGKIARPAPRKGATKLP